MKLGELRSEIQQSAKSPYGEKLYPITSDWIPVTDVLAIVDRFERELRCQFDSVLATAKSQSKKEIEELLLRIVSNLLPEVDEKPGDESVKKSRVNCSAR